MRLMADLRMTASLRAMCSASHSPRRRTRTARSIRSSMVIPFASMASTAAIISSRVVAVRKPRPPRFTPRMGTPSSPTARAMESRVPSPPSTMSRSTWPGRSSRRTVGTVALSTSALVSLSRATPIPRSVSQSTRRAKRGRRFRGVRLSPRCRRASCQRFDALLDEGFEVALPSARAWTNAERTRGYPWDRAGARASPPARASREGSRSGPRAPRRPDAG